MHITRIYDNLEKYLSPNQALIIYGPRQVGKTTLLTNFLKNTDLKYKLISGDDLDAQNVIGSQHISLIKEYVKGYELIAIDEAQKIPHVGDGLKIMVDNIPDIKIIATGSSSLDLSGQIGEPLTGRKKTLTLYPVSQMELVNLYNPYELKEKLGDWLIFGSYPKVVVTSDKQEQKNIITEITHSYLLKDILELEKIKNSKIILDLLRLMAFQIGQEVSLSELGQQLGLNYKTVARYLDLLEKSFVIYNLRGFSRNLRQEINKKSKYYFYDLGIRNAIISNFNSLELRDDIGPLWENFLVMERLKKQAYTSLGSNNYFWRTWGKQEIDWVEEREGKLFGYEFKWRAQKSKTPNDFLKNYNGSEYAVINRENYLDFIT